MNRSPLAMMSSRMLRSTSFLVQHLQKLLIESTGILIINSLLVLYILINIIDLEGYFFFHSACPFPLSPSNMFKQYLEKELQKVFCVPLALLS